MTADEVFRLVAAQLPDTWQISALMGYVIMYDDKRVDYPSAWRYYRGSEVVAHQPASKPANSKDEEPEDDEEEEARSF
jgi:hypothetical protein